MCREVVDHSERGEERDGLSCNLAECHTSGMKILIRVRGQDENDSDNLRPDRHLLVVVHAVATVHTKEGTAGLSAGPEKKDNSSVSFTVHSTTFVGSPNQAIYTFTLRPG